MGREEPKPSFAEMGFRGAQPILQMLQMDAKNAEGEVAMAQKITTGYRALVDAAQREIETLGVEDAMKLHGRDDVVFVDLRDIRELDRDGRIPGAFHCPRGMLEFWVDPQSPHHKPVFAEDKQFVFFCNG